MTKVSVICCFYNRPEAVRTTLYGLRDQTFRDVEFIISDDASSDETPQLLKQVIDELGDQRFRLILRKDNIGLTRGLIAGIEGATGEYIAIHDAGDASLPRRLERQAQALDENPDVAVVGCHYVNYIQEMGLYRIRKPNVEEKSTDDLILDTTFTHGEVMFRRANYDAVGGYRPEFRMSQDNDLWLRMRHTGKFMTVPETLYIRSVDFSGISFGTGTVARQSSFYILGKKIARGEIDAATALAHLANSGEVAALAPISDPEVQAQLFKVAVRSAIFGAPETGRIIAKTYLREGFKNKLLLWTLSLLALPVSRPVLGYARKLLGMKSGVPTGWPDVSLAD